MNQLEPVKNTSLEAKKEYSRHPWPQIESMTKDPVGTIAEIVEKFDVRNHIGVSGRQISTLKRNKDLYEEVMLSLEQSVGLTCEMLGWKPSAPLLRKLTTDIMRDFYHLHFEEVVKALDDIASSKVDVGRPVPYTFNSPYVMDCIKAYDVWRTAKAMSRSDRYKESGSDKRSSSRGDDGHMSIRNLTEALKNKRDE